MATLAILARPQAGMRMLLALVIFAVVVEGGQWFVPTRTVDTVDLALNLLGIALAWLPRSFIRLIG